MTALDALGNGIASVASWGAAIRRSRLLHPAGAAFEATFTVTPTTSYGVPLLDEPRTYRAVARLSKATSTPRDWPDVLGLAWRVEDAGGPGAPLDIALSTTGRAVLLRHVLMPRRDFARATFTSLPPYRDRRKEPVPGRGARHPPGHPRGHSFPGRQGSRSTVRADGDGRRPHRSVAPGGRPPHRPGE